jgi:hypothetical protein
VCHSVFRWRKRSTSDGDVAAVTGDAGFQSVEGSHKSIDDAVPH